jgi:DNA repair protein RadC
MNTDILKDHEGHRDRLRKRFITSPDLLSESDILELILTYSIPRKNITPIVNNLLQHFGNIKGIMSASITDLTMISGVGESTAILIKLINNIRIKENTMQQPYLFSQNELPVETQKTETQNMRVFANDEIVNTLHLLPKAPSFSNLEEFKIFLMTNLPYNSEETRRRRANYIIERFYSSGVLNTSLTLLLNNEPHEKILKQIVFYHILKSEPISAKVAEELIFPLLPIGRTNRDQLKDFVLKYLPTISDSSIKNMLRAILYSYSLLGIGTLNGEILRFQLRQGEFESFIYIFTSEFSKPDIYTFDQLYQGPLHRWLLWDREWLRIQLYNLRDLGIISKISEIDSVKQFTVSLNQTESLNAFYSKSNEKNFYLREKNQISSKIQSGNG